MKIRVLQLRSQFYQDETLEENIKKPTGEFLTFGVYDTLSINEGKIYNQNNLQTIWKCLSENSVEHLDGKSNQRDVVCILHENKQSEEREEQFWEKKDCPYLFISMLQINKQSQPIWELKKNIESITNSPSEVSDIVVYLSNGHTELTIAYYVDAYQTGINYIKKLRTLFCVRKMYSFFAVRQSALQNNAWGSTINEVINCNLRAVIKKMEKLDNFVSKLKKRLPQSDINVYDILGNGDVIIAISNVNMHTFLPLYATKGLLSNANDLFYSIETEFLAVRS